MTSEKVVGWREGDAWPPPWAPERGGTCRACLGGGPVWLESPDAPAYLYCGGCPPSRTPAHLSPTVEDLTARRAALPVLDADGGDLANAVAVALSEVVPGGVPEGAVAVLEVVGGVAFLEWPGGGLRIEGARELEAGLVAWRGRDGTEVVG